MDDFVMYVDRRAVRFQRKLDDIHGAYYARAETPRPYPQQYFSIRCSRHFGPKWLISEDSIIPHSPASRFPKVPFHLTPSIPLVFRISMKKKTTTTADCQFAYFLCRWRRGIERRQGRRAAPGNLSRYYEYNR